MGSSQNQKRNSIDSMEDVIVSPRISSLPISKKPISKEKSDHVDIKNSRKKLSASVSQAPEAKQNKEEKKSTVSSSKHKVGKKTTEEYGIKDEVKEKESAEVSGSKHKVGKKITEVSESKAKINNKRRVSSDHQKGTKKT